MVSGGCTCNANRVCLRVLRRLLDDVESKSRLTSVSASAMRFRSVPATCRRSRRAAGWLYGRLYGLGVEAFEFHHA
jgi:hypothetical protein